MSPSDTPGDEGCIKVLIVDDHSLVRAGFRALLEASDDIRVVAEASNGREALTLIAEHSPDLVLMDVAMRELNGLEAAGQITRRFPEVRVIIVSMHCHREYLERAVRYGVSGYVVKDAAPAELETAIREVMNGNTYLLPVISARGVFPTRPSETDLDKLPPRQREVLQLLAEGKTIKEIAFLLGVSFKTIETHRAALMRRLRIQHLPGLVCYAIEKGLIFVASTPTD